MNNHSKERWGHLIGAVVLLFVTIGASSVIAQTPEDPVTGNFSGLVYNRATQTFNSVLTLTNTGATTLASPIVVVIATSTAAVTVAGTSDGSTYIANLSGGSLAPGASANVVVPFADSARVAFTPSITSIITTDATSTATIGIAGGIISATNHLGDVLTLTIPPLALTEDTAISVSALNSPLASPITDVLYPGAIFQPEGLQFNQPANVAVTLHAGLDAPSAGLIFWLMNPSLPLPIAGQTGTPSSVQGQILHFSSFDAALPTYGELSGLITETNAAASATLSNLQANPSSITPGALRTFYDYLASELTDAGYAQLRGDDDLASTAFLNAGAQVNTLAALVNKASLPDAPCGLYTLAVYDIAVAEQRFGATDPSDTLALTSRGCTFRIAPTTLSLKAGQTVPQAFAATLLGPKGNQKSCKIINWISDDYGVADIVPIYANSNVATPTGIGLGIAKVAAVCDGLIAQATVTVGEAYTLSWTATYTESYNDGAGDTESWNGSITGVVAFDANLNVANVSATGNSSESAVSSVASGGVEIPRDEFSTGTGVILDAGPLSAWQSWLGPSGTPGQCCQPTYGKDAQGKYFTNPFYASQAAIVAAGSCVNGIHFPVDTSVGYIEDEVSPPSFSLDTYITDFPVCADGDSPYLRPDPADPTGKTFSNNSTITYIYPGPYAATSTVTWKISLVVGAAN
jgi:hypothetical protein